MNIREIYRKKKQLKKTVISFEIFPPKKKNTVDTIYKTIESLSELNPDFISVTYGTGGKTKDNTIEIASIIKKRYGITTLAHLTCISSTKNQMESIVNNLKKNNIQNILALRGDFPKDPNFKFPTPLHYEHASDLISELKRNDEYCIGAAYYPEGHVESPDLETDLRYLKKKVKSGVDFLISQMFFENKYYYTYKKKINTIGIKIPLSAGIMPVTSKKQINIIADLCGSTIPNKLIKIMDKYENDPDRLKEEGIQYAVNQIRDLIKNGVDGIHLYTMNKPKIAKSIYNKISDLL